MVNLREKDALNTSSSKLLISLAAMAICSATINVSTLIGVVRRKKSKLFRSILVMAVVDFIFCSIFIFHMISKVVCETTESKCNRITAFCLAWIQFINAELLFPLMSWNNLFLESYITVQRFLCVCTISNSYLIRIKNASVWKVALLCLLLTSIIHLHRFSSRSIRFNVNRSNSTHFLISDFVRFKNAYGQTKLSVGIMTFFVTVQMLIMFVVLLIINIVTIFKLKTYLKRRSNEYSAGSKSNSDRADSKLIRHTDSPSDTNRNNALLVIPVSFLYLFANLPFVAFFVMSRLLELKPIYWKNVFFAGQLTQISSIIIKFLIYYSFNKLFRARLHSNFRFVFGLRHRSRRPDNFR